MGRYAAHRCGEIPVMSYQKFAYYYDSLMDEDFYSGYLHFIMNNAVFETVLELGCGTGIMAIELSKLNKTVYATDLSKQMLEVAKMNAAEANVDLMLGKIDMCDFMINEPVDLILCMCDSLNYILTPNKVLKVFKNVFNALKAEGTFIFDVHSMHKINVTFEDYTEEAEDDDFYFKWTVHKISEGKIRHHVQIVDQENHDRVDERHEQQTYPVETYIDLLEKAGFKTIHYYSDFKEYNEQDDRVIFVVKK